MNILSHRIYVGPFNSTVYYPVGKVVGLPFLKLHFIYTALYGGWERTCKFFFYPFSRLFILVEKNFFGVFFSIFPTFHFRFPDFLLPFPRLFTSGSEKSGKRK